MMVFILFLICAAAYDPLVKNAIKWFQALYFLSSFFGAPLSTNYGVTSDSTLIWVFCTLTSASGCAHAILSCNQILW